MLQATVMEQSDNLRQITHGTALQHANILRHCLQTRQIIILMRANPRS